MYLKDPAGNWYEVDEEALKGKSVDEQKAREALAAERAEKRKKIVDMVARLDSEEIRILRGQLGIGRGQPTTLDCTRRGAASGIHFGSDCDPSDCDCANCDCGDCDPSDCDCANCDCGDCGSSDFDCMGVNCDCIGGGWGNAPRRPGWNRGGRYFGPGGGSAQGRWSAWPQGGTRGVVRSRFGAARRRAVRR